VKKGDRDRILEAGFKYIVERDRKNQAEASRLAAGKVLVELCREAGKKRVAGSVPGKGGYRINVGYDKSPLTRIDEARLMGVLSNHKLVELATRTVVDQDKLVMLLEQPDLDDAARREIMACIERKVIRKPFARELKS